ncbi:clathrin associated protein complex medium subunit [Didymosphaeria variabile]|uniref:Clathrin associated protein complex medium subunit n=1 Tax=Didymosphaeria variabile TaxID=1932322 RepID=A0A9W9CAH5_9PLEO|nr:clathrin associated protein complex medium subunit [Didymosphaeria variabile]KAJ4353721.1 clathrin associated protein complex medium subunit [Didymosphaeria variabile]
MLSGILIFNQKGENLIFRAFRNDCRPRLADVFRIQVISNAQVRSPILTLGSTTFSHVKHENIYLVAVTKSNANAALVFEFIYRLIALGKAYFGKFDEEAVKNNFVLVYELLDEILDFGYPQNTETDTLKMYITTEGVKSERAMEDSSKITMQATGATSWRRSDIKYRKNEAFVDVIEDVNLLMSATGTVLRADVNGQIIMRAYLSGTPECKFGLNDRLTLGDDNLQGPSGNKAGAKATRAAAGSVSLEDCQFHQCVKLGKFDADRIISFIPPDGEFELMRYRATENVNLPFKVHAIVNEVGKTKVEYSIAIRANYGSKLFATNVVVRIPTPLNTARITERTSQGKAKYEPEHNNIVWKIPRFTGQSEFVLSAEASLTSMTNQKAWSRPPLNLSFSLLMFTSSGLLVRYLKVFEKSNYSSVKWVRYMTRAGNYEIRNGLSQEAERYFVKAKLVRESLVTIIQAPSTSLVDDSLREYAQNMRICADTYLSTLDGLRIKDSSKRSTAWGAAVRFWWKRAELDQSSTTIERVGTQIAAYIVATHIPTMRSGLNGIQEHNLRMEASLYNKMEELSSQASQNNEKLKCHSKDILEATRRWFEHQEQVKIQRRCLQALHFPQIESRENDVKEAHVKTFGWILEDLQPALDLPQRSNFKQWLRSPDQNANVFWISGKPGSGKSTLMKYLVQRAKQPKHIGEWVSDKQLIVAECFFWRYGSRLQRSLNGLVRSLLYHILEQCPDLIATAFPGFDRLRDRADYEFPQKALEEAFTRITNGLDDRNARLFIMIDGLDEFDDREERGPSLHDQQDLIKLLGVFCRNEAIKLCISSRPLPVFMQEYGQDQGRYIRMQDLTSDDIRMYIREELENNKAFQQLAMDNQEYNHLVNEIVDAAQGVFLWVHLAVRSLLQGITNEDGLAGLRERLRQLPRELDDLYKHILHSIESIYQRSSTLMLLAHVDAEYEASIPLFLNYLDDYECTVLSQTRKLDNVQLINIQEKFNGRLNARCRGLLEYTKPCFGLHTSPALTVSGVPSFEFLSHSSATAAVTSCHRSVVDFLRKPEIRTWLLERARLSPEQLHLFYCRACVAVIEVIFLLINGETTANLFGGYARVNGIISFFMHCADQLKADVVDPLRTKLDHLLVQPAFEGGHSLINRIIPYFMSQRYDLDSCPPISESNILAFLAYFTYGTEYIKTRLRDDSELVGIDDQGCSLLYVACLHWRANPGKGDLVLLLLEYGSNPNQMVQSITPWQRIVTDTFAAVCANFYYNLVRESPRVRATVHAFIRHGADLDVPCSFVGCIGDGGSGLDFHRTPWTRNGNTPLILHEPGIRSSTCCCQPQPHNTSQIRFSLSAGVVARYLCHFYGVVLDQEVSDALQNYAAPEELEAYLGEISRDLSVKVEAGRQEEPRTS